MRYVPDSYLDPSTKPFSFCPGCSHRIVLEALAQALVRVGVPPEKVVLVTDIGCIGISDRHFKMHTFHGLHGRSVTYACGLKLAAPELTVVVLMGDGGLGIGGHHFLHAARRNVDITVLVCNNFNFGMTGGQHSVTTPHGALTATTIGGNFEYPLDVIGLADVAKAAYGARCLYTDERLPDLIAEGIRVRGFAVVDIWETCTAHFFRRNKVSKSYLEREMNALGLKTGVVMKRDTVDYLTQYNRAIESIATAKPSAGLRLESEFQSPSKGRVSVLLAGRAGQKVRSTAILLGRAGVLSGRWVTQRDDYPITVMTGHSMAELILEDQPVDELVVEHPDVVILTALEGKEVVSQRLEKLPSTSVVYVVPGLGELNTKARVVTVPLGTLGLERKRTQLALGVTAWVAPRERLVSVEALLRSASLDHRKEIAAENIATIENVTKGLANPGGLL